MRPHLATVLAFLFPLFVQPAGASASPFRTNDVIAFLGGASAIAIEQSGALESLLLLAHPGHQLRFRSLAWEGDTVHRRPRELNFPTLPELLRAHHATVVCLQFGALEATQPNPDPARFRAAYDRLLDELAPSVPRLILVIPPPFEPQPSPLPDLAPGNDALALLAAATRDLAATRQLPIVDLFSDLTRHPPPSPWTHDGREPNPAGHLAIAAAWLRQLGFPDLARRATEPAFWRHDDVVRLRSSVRRKNQLWTAYHRPMNWAFLHGDRTEQLASHDHLDPRIRWFPDEMNQYPPLIAEAELRIHSLAAQSRLP